MTFNMNTHLGCDFLKRDVAMQVAKKAFGAISRGVGFYTRQERDWKISAVRTNSTMFFYRLVLPYLSIYTMALGATGTQLGIVNSVGMGVAGIVGPLSGWLIDKFGVKRIYLIGIVILAGAYLIYGLAQSWVIIIVAMVAYWLGNNTSIQGCSVICGNCLKSDERATGMSICETFGMGLPLPWLEPGWLQPLVG
jgi:MFS family permease